jgi:hypothetical protein
MRYRFIAENADSVWRWLAWMLPRKLVYWAAIRLMGHATMGQYGETDPNDLPVMEALHRWDT